LERPRSQLAPALRVGLPPKAWSFARTHEHLYGYDLRDWEVWFLQGMWPCRTHGDVRHMEEMMAHARHRGADVRRWFT